MITLKMADQGRSDINVVFSRIHCGLNFCVRVSYEGNIAMVVSNSFSEPVYSILKPYGVK